MAGQQAVQALVRRWWGVAACALALLVIGFAVCVQTGVGGTAVTNWLDDLTETAAAFIAAAASVAAASRHRGRLRAAWALMGASALCWGLGQLAWDWYQLLAGVQVPFPSLADAGYLSAVPFAIAAVLLFPVAFERASSVVNSLIDGLVIAASLLIVSWETVLGAVFRAGAGGPLAMVLSLAYPLSDAAIITMIVIRVGRVPRAMRLPLVLMAAGLLVIALADSSFTYLTAQGTYGNGNVLDTGWVAGYLLIALGALKAAARPVREAPPKTLTPRWLRFLPYPPVAIALGVIIGERIGTATVSNFAFWTLLAVVALVLVRQHLALGTNEALLGSLAAREREMEYQAHHDALTGLPNRVYFRDIVARALARQADVGARCAVLFIDLDDFKKINDTFGHAVGDSVLTEVGSRLRLGLRPTDIAARLGGDEFAVLVGSTRSEGDLSTIASRLLEMLRKPASVEGLPLEIRGTIGIAVGDATIAGCDELLRQADVALYAAKSEGKDRFSVFRVLAA
jgi:diguanylate cyclase (GGDEF)-like protein